MRITRIILEITGVVSIAILHYFIAWCYLFAATLDGLNPILFWSAIGIGYLSMVVMMRLQPKPMASLPKRTVFDFWLITFLPAMGITYILIYMEFPLQFKSWDGHGMGVAGGLANSLFLPWLHSKLWIVSLKLYHKPLTAQ